MRVLASTSAAIVCILGLAFALLGAADNASGQPTEQQVAAIKSSCRSDYMSYCWSVPRGGAEAMQCLKKNLASLSAACQQAVKAISPPAAPPAATADKTPESAPAATPPAAAATPATTETPPSPETSEAKPVPAAAENTPASPAKAAETTAKSAAPPPQTATESSPPAKNAKVEAPAGASAPSSIPAPNTAPGTPAAASEVTPPIIGFIPPRKKLMVLRNCRQDLETYCAGVDYGEGRQLRCLMSNQASLTPDCQGALAKLAE